MPDPHDAESPFWNYSLSIYDNERVASACIALQDRCGLDVNMLLFALYAASRGRVLSPTDLQALEDAVAPWRSNVVQPLRSVRRWLKRTEGGDSATQALGAAVLAQEIKAEAQQQRSMERAVVITGAPADMGSAADNLLRYVRSCGVAVDEHVIAELSVLLAHAFPSVDGAGATTLLRKRAGRAA